MPMSPNAESPHQNGNSLALPSAASTLDIPSSEPRAESNGDRPKTAPSGSSSPPVVTVSGVTSRPMQTHITLLTTIQAAN